MKNSEFDGKVALITGAASGLGAAIAIAFADKGASVAVVDIDEKNGKKIVDQITDKGGQAEFIHGDVSDINAVEKMVKDTVDSLGRLDFAVNNAGIGGAQAPTHRFPVENWLQVIEVNLNGVFYCMRFEIPQILKQGGGAIVNISSILGKVGFKNTAAYTASKHGVVGLTKTAALEYADKDLRINAVGPGFIRTPMVTDGFEEDALAQIKSLHAMGRLGKPKEVANLVVFLCSDEASFMTGAYYLVDGGYTAV